MLRRFGVDFVIFSVVVDGIAIWLALRLAYWQRPALQWLPFSQRLDAAINPSDTLQVLVTLLWIVVLFRYALYDPRQVFHLGDELRNLAQGVALAGLASAGLLYIVDRDLSRWTFIVFALVAFIALITWRFIARVIIAALGRPTLPVRRVLIVGGGSTGWQIARLVDSYRWTGLKFVGFVGDPREGEGNGVIGPVSEIRAIAERVSVDEVIVAPPYSHSHLRAVVDALQDRPVHIRTVPLYADLILRGHAIEDFGGVPLADLRAGPLTEYQRAAKRAFDLAIGSLLTLVILPAMAVIALLIHRQDPTGPVIFRQPRVGENGRVFTMYKFRTMVPDAELKLKDVIRRDANGSAVHKQSDDPRVTPIGRFLRRTSLDELPQLFNVLKGDMSLVGPRPELPWLVKEYEPWQRSRLAVPQGLTGWWQINGRSDKLMHLHTDLDLYYVTHYSFWLDLQILWKTLWVVLHGKGAY